LDIARALCRVEWDNGAQLETFVHADDQTGWFRFKNVPDGFQPHIIPPQYQKMSPSGFEYEVAVSWKTEDHSVTGVWSISSTFSESEGNPPAGELVERKQCEESFDESFARHGNWWERYWQKSYISLPDTLLEKQYYLEMYKFGSVARDDAPPISLQAVWTADNGKLPPWKGDFHHDLNTQLSYWPAYTGNHLDLEYGFINWLWKYKQTFKEYTETYFGTSGLNVPGVTTLTGQPK
jgi:alpha-L-fucosidase 2